MAIYVNAETYYHAKKKNRLKKTLENRKFPQKCSSKVRTLVRTACCMLAD